MRYIFDIDGTIADCSQRLHFIQQEKPDWGSFYKDCVNDKPIPTTLEVLCALQKHGAKIVFVTGRPEKYMDETMDWLRNQVDTNCVSLFMRKMAAIVQITLLKKKYTKPR